MPRNKKNKITVTFAPNAFDDFDGTQEELDALIAEIQRMAESGELEEHSIPLDEEHLADLTDEERDIIEQAVDNAAKPRRLN